MQTMYPHVGRIITHGLSRLTAIFFTGGIDEEICFV